MLQEKAGEFAGKIWNVLNGTEGMTTAQIKKAAEMTDKELYLGLGWLLREDKVATEEVKGKVVVSLK
ncbi:MAG: winged helix-turn-helix domain-containing protein [Bacteroides sp.]|nr:winged helix-turn-helix domain-containing protein [Bacteroides sp.]MBQ8224091.1 winged helix-turn-helix domain-containing protein [Bacteroides sp.]